MMERQQTRSDIRQQVKKKKEKEKWYQAVLQTDVVVGLLSDADGFLQSEVGLLTEQTT